MLCMTVAPKIQGKSEMGIHSLSCLNNRSCALHLVQWEVQNKDSALKAELEDMMWIYEWKRHVSG